MAVELTLRLIIDKPSDYQHVFWESEEPRREGYWGHVRSADDYAALKSEIIEAFDRLATELNDEGIHVRFLPPKEVAAVADVMNGFDELGEADLNILLPVFTMVWTGWGNLVYAVNAASHSLLIYDRFEPYSFGGTLYTPPTYQKFKEFGLDRNVFVSEGSDEKAKSVIRSLYAVKAIGDARLVCVGPVHEDFGGWGAYRKANDLFGWRTKFYTYDRFLEDFNRFYADEEKRQEAMQLAAPYRRGATGVQLVADDDFLRSAVFGLVLRSYLDEFDGTWVTVHYYVGAMMQGTKTSCCMSYSLFNDSGDVVATCEADVGAMTLQYLMRYLASRPAFLIDPTVNEKTSSLVLAHCTSPLRMMGFDTPKLPYEIRPCHDTGTGAAPKPTYPTGEVTVAGLSFDMSEMLIIVGDVVSSPDFRICHAQVEVRVPRPREILEHWKGFHWILVYGDFVDELEMICGMKGISPHVIR